MIRHTILAPVIFATLLASAPPPSRSGVPNHVGSSQVPSTNVAPDSMGSYNFVLGTWRCSGLTPPGKVDCTFTQDVTSILNDHWFRFADSESDSGSGEAFMTYDGKRRLWIYISIGVRWRLFDGHQPRVEGQ